MEYHSQNPVYPAHTQGATTDPTVEQAINVVVQGRNLDGDVDGGALTTHLSSNPATQQSIKAFVCRNFFAKRIGGGVNENIAAQQITTFVGDNEFHGFVGGGVNCDLGAVSRRDNDWDRVAQRPQIITATVEGNVFGGNVGGGINDNLGAVSRGGDDWADQL